MRQNQATLLFWPSQCRSILRNIICSYFEDLACCHLLCRHRFCQRVTFKVDLGVWSPVACLGRAHQWAVCSDWICRSKSHPIHQTHLIFPWTPLLTQPYLPPHFCVSRALPKGPPPFLASFAPCPFINPNSFVSLPLLFLRRPVFKFKLIFLRIRSTLEIAVDGKQWWARPCCLHCFRWARPRILTQKTLWKTANRKGNIRISHISAVCHLFKSACKKRETDWQTYFLVYLFYPPTGKQIWITNRQTVQWNFSLPISSCLHFLWRFNGVLL